jgi:ubiquinone/menaquinone biosynthesis C-methylase UbiE
VAPGPGSAAGQANGPAAQTAQVVAAFDDAAPGYDASGVQFAGPIAARLVELAGLRPGWRLLDAGCGAGAVLTRAAPAVSPGGRVDGVDLAPGMLARARSECSRLMLSNVSLHEGDAADPPFPAATFDAVLASLVMYLLADPRAAAARWLDLVKPGGTVAFSWGVGPDPRWTPVMAAVEAYGPPGAGFESYVRRLGAPPEMEAMLADCGFCDAATTVETVEVRYVDPGQWWEATRWEGPWLTWRHIPPDDLPAARREALSMLDGMREPDGGLVRRVRTAYTVAHRGAAG